MSGAPEPKFSEPWHADVFAITVALNEAGHFDWPDWASQFGATLKRNGLNRELNGGDDYFAAWLETLEHYLARLGMADAQEVSKIKAAWESAYLSTAHGAPVRLTD